MRSSSGAHFLALDHVRALAIFLVFTWHFTHTEHGSPIPFEYVPALFPFAILDEGHTGVALFMTLSGYLFAKLLAGKSIHYGAFLWNRALRLLPLLILVLIVNGLGKYVSGENIVDYVLSVLKGAVYPTLPNGGWSLTVEFHFYAILPLFLWLLKKSKLLPLSIIAAALALRWFLYHENGEVQSLAYMTIIGRIDQFALGMLACQFRVRFAKRHLLAGASLLGFLWLYWYFDWHGGFYKNPVFPSPRPFWILLPTVEGLAYAIAIAWYDNSFAPYASGMARFIGTIGEYSYSIYLLHFYVVFYAAKFIHERIMDISNFYLACLWATAVFLMMMIPGYLSFRFIEAPFLKLRKSYIT